MYVASDIPAILEHTRHMAFLEPAQIAVINCDGVIVHTLDGEPISLDVQTVPWDPVSAEKGEYKHFMLKEIFEQPEAIANAMRGRLEPGEMAQVTIVATVKREPWQVRC